MTGLPQRRTVRILLSLLTGALVAATQVAMPSPAAAVAWPAPPCADGEINGWVRGGAVAVYGWISPCEQPPADAFFALTLYPVVRGADGQPGTPVQAYGRRKVLYWSAAITDPLVIAGGGTVGVSEAYETVGVCLSRHATARLSCLRIDNPSPDRADDLSVSVIPTTDPLVQRGALPPSTPGLPATPSCGSCW